MRSPALLPAVSALVCVLAVVWLAGVLVGALTLMAAIQAYATGLLHERYHSITSVLAWPSIDPDEDTP